MIRIMFVCHGNICRSPMAEFIMKDLVRKENLNAVRKYISIILFVALESPFCFRRYNSLYSFALGGFI
jgi:hypothetical protein